MNARPVPIRLVIVAIVSGFAAGALTALVFAVWGPSIPWIVGGGRPVGSPNMIPVIVTACVTSHIIMSGTSRLQHRRGA